MSRKFSFGALLVVLIAGSVLYFQPATGSASTTAAAQAQQLNLITATPDEGFALAVTLSRRGVSTTQTDREVLQRLRPDYANDAESLIAASQVIAVHFQTIAAANDYWR